MFCVLQKKVLSFGPNRTVEVRLNSSAEPNVWSITRVHAKSFCVEKYMCSMTQLAKMKQLLNFLLFWRLTASNFVCNENSFRCKYDQQARPCPFIQILSKFYLNFIQILSKFYPNKFRIKPG